MCLYLQVKVVLEGVDKFNNLIGTLHYAKGDVAVNLALELVQQVWMASNDLNLRTTAFCQQLDSLLLQLHASERNGIPNNLSNNQVLLVQGLAKVAEWSANMLEDGEKRKLKAAELQAKKDRIRMWVNYVPPASNSTAIQNQNFTGKVG